MKKRIYNYRTNAHPFNFTFFGSNKNFETLLRILDVISNSKINSFCTRKYIIINSVNVFKRVDFSFFLVGSMKNCLSFPDFDFLKNILEETSIIFTQVTFFDRKYTLGSLSSTFIKNNTGTLLPRSGDNAVLVSDSKKDVLVSLN